jgi:signal transduction histidine kinase
MQVLFNLVGNALKFTFEGYIKFCVSIDEVLMLRIVIEDTGMGIKVEDQDKLFKFFGKL